MEPRNILELTKQEKREFIDSFDHVFCDGDGTLWKMMSQIDGVNHGVKSLQNAGKSFTLVTDNSVRLEENYCKLLNNMGVDTTKIKLAHPARNVVDYLQSINFTGLIYVIGSPNFKSVLIKAGFRIYDGPDQKVEDNFLAMLKEVMDNQPVRAVVVDFDFNLSYAKILKAQYHLRNSDCLFLAGALEDMLPVRDDFSVIGPGVFPKILDAVFPQRMITLAKPSKDLGRLMLKLANIEKPERVLVIGDMLDFDISFAKNNGFQSLLVLTGVATLDDLKLPQNHKYIPDYYAKSIEAFAEMF